MTNIKLNGRRPMGGRKPFDWLHDIIQLKPKKHNYYETQALYQKPANQDTKPVNTLEIPVIQFKIKYIELNIPKINTQQFLFILLSIIVCISLFLAYEIYIYVKDEYEYRERVRHEIVYNIERYLEPYAAKQRDLELKIDTLNEILPLDSEFRRRLILKYTGHDIRNEKPQ